MRPFAQRERPVGLRTLPARPTVLYVWMHHIHVLVEPYGTCTVQLY